MPEHQGYILLPLGAEYPQRLSDLPLAGEGSPERKGIVAAAHNPNVHVFPWRDVSLLKTMLHTVADNRSVCVSLVLRVSTTHTSTYTRMMSSVSTTSTETIVAKSYSSI